MVLKQCKICPTCGKELPETRQHFRSNRIHGKEVFHVSCRQCEDIVRNMPEWNNGLLLCHRCHQYKPEETFTPNNTHNEERHNRRHICNECNTQRQREHDKALDDNRKLDKCLRYRYLGARERAIRNGIPFDITLDFLHQLWDKQNGLCALSGVPMTFELKEGRVPTNVSIDKICSAFGYTMTNVQLVCMACNQIKSDLTEIEMYNFCKKIVENYESKNNINTEK